ncbi:MAG: fimbrial protein [Myxococcaceae bacterium]
MKIFCTRCGTPSEVEPAAATAVITCSQCGHQFSAQPGAAPPAKSRSTLIVLIVLAVFAVPCVVGILAAIAIPNFIRFQERSKQNECKSNLRSLYTAERAYFQEKEAFTEQVSLAGFSPQRGNRYAYFASASGPTHLPGALATEESTGVEVDLERFPSLAVERGDLPALFAGGVGLGISGQCPDCQFTAACAGKIRSSGAIDIWSVSTEAREGPNGETIPAGTPFNETRF